MDYMMISVNRFLNYSYNHGNCIKIVNNIPSKTTGEVYKTLWEGKFETIENHIPYDIKELEVVKWGIENNSIVIYVNYEEVK